MVPDSVHTSLQFFHLRASTGWTAPQRIEELWRVGWLLNGRLERGAWHPPSPPLLMGALLPHHVKTSWDLAARPRR